MKHPRPYSFVWTLPWLGLLLASCLGAVAKFAAPSLPYAVGLDVGRHVFALLFRAELVLAAGTMVSLLLGPKNKLAMAAGLALIPILALQGLWLLPALGAHAEALLAGEFPPPSHLHRIYILLDGIKVLLLVAISASALRRWSR